MRTNSHAYAGVYTHHIPSSSSQTVCTLVYTKNTKYTLYYDGGLSGVVLLGEVILTYGRQHLHKMHVICSFPLYYV